MTTRAQAAENGLASERTEGLDPGVIEALLRGTRESSDVPTRRRGASLARLSSVAA